MERLTEAMERVKTCVDLRAYCDTHLEAARGRDVYVCPACGSGNGPRKTAAFHLYGGGTRWKCSSCEAGGDVFDLCGVIYGTDDRAEQCNTVAQWAGVEGWTPDNRPLELGQTIQDEGRAYGWEDVVPTDDWQPGQHGTTQDGHVAAQGTPSTSRGDEAKSNVAEGTDTWAGTEAQGDGDPDYTTFYQEAHDALMNSPEALAYLQSRGITYESMERYNLGYVSSWTHPKDGRHRTKRIVIPRTAATYTARAMDPSERDYNDAYKKQVVGHQTDLFNLEAVRGADVIVCVEGELDAISIEQATGYAAVGIGSTSNAGSFAERAKDVAPRALWLISLDNDAAKEDGRNPGRDAQDRLMAGMADAGLRAVAVDGARLYGGCKDANEALVAYPYYLKDALDTILGDLEEEAWRVRLGQYDVRPTVEIMRDLHELKDGREPIPTGLKGLDNVLGGGLHAKSLHVIGAQSSEGKTTITLQVADNVARAGHPVLFVTIEQRASELMAKSLARVARTHNGGDTILTARQITNPAGRRKWGQREWDALNAACQKYYAEVAPHMSFMDPDEPPTVQRIWQCAEAMAERYGEAPVVFLDYLQICAPEPGHERDSDKQVTDHNITLLRRLAGSLNTPVWVVASLNRQSYNAPISTDSFKESGAIEYGADVLMGLEPFDLATRWHNEAEKKRTWLANRMHAATRRATKRWMDMQVLKNRFGALPGDPLAFVYHAPADTFEYVWRVRREKLADDFKLGGDPALSWDTEDDEDGLVM